MLQADESGGHKGPDEAHSGPIEARGRGGAVTTTDHAFLLPPRCVNLVPTPVLVGTELLLSGTNLPVALEEVRVEVLGSPGAGGFGRPLDAGRPRSGRLGDRRRLRPLRRLHRHGAPAAGGSPRAVVQNLVAAAPQAAWSTSAGLVPFGSVPDSTAPGVQSRARRAPGRRPGLQSGALPAPALACAARVARRLPGDRRAGHRQARAAAGDGHALERRTAAGRPGRSRRSALRGFFPFDRDGKEIALLPRSACVFDGSLERYVLDAGALASKRGQVVLSIFPGRSGFRDDAAVAAARLVQLM